MKTEFVPLPGYENLNEINSAGVIKSIPRSFYDRLKRHIKVKGQVISTRIDRRSGYPVIKLTKPDGSYGHQYIHRLLAIAFIPNPDRKSIVNHINGNKLDYRLENLEWVTRSQNQKHAIATNLARIPAYNKTPVINICTGEHYENIKRAAQCIGEPYHRCKVFLSGRIPNPTCLRRA